MIVVKTVARIGKNPGVRWEVWRDETFLSWHWTEAAAMTRAARLRQ